MTTQTLRLPTVEYSHQCNARFEPAPDDGSPMCTYGTDLDWVAVEIRDAGDMLLHFDYSVACSTAEWNLHERFEHVLLAAREWRERGLGHLLESDVSDDEEVGPEQLERTFRDRIEAALEKEAVSLHAEWQDLEKEAWREYLQDKVVFRVHTRRAWNTFNLYIVPADEADAWEKALDAPEGYFRLDSELAVAQCVEPVRYDKWYGGLVVV